MTLIQLFTEAWLTAQITFRRRFEPLGAASAILDGNFGDTTVAKLRELCHKRALAVASELNGFAAVYHGERAALEQAIEAETGLTLRPVPTSLRAGFGTKWLLDQSDKTLVSKIFTGKTLTDSEVVIVKQWAMERGINVDGLVG